MNATDWQALGEVPDCKCAVKFRKTLPYEQLVGGERYGDVAQKVNGYVRLWIDIFNVEWCPHVAACAHDEREDIDEWMAQLWEKAPEEFREPPPPIAPTVALPGPGSAKIRVLRRRAGAGQGLWHPDDAAHVKVKWIGRNAQRLDNGSKRTLEWARIDLAEVGNDDD